MTMGFTVARYTVKPGLEERNAELVRAVHRELAALRPTGFRYATRPASATPPTASMTAAPSSTSPSATWTATTRFPASRRSATSRRAFASAVSGGRRWVAPS